MKATNDTRLGDRSDTLRSVFAIFDSLAGRTVSEFLNLLDLAICAKHIEQSGCCTVINCIYNSHTTINFGCKVLVQTRKAYVFELDLFFMFICATIKSHTRTNTQYIMCKKQNKPKNK